MRSKGLSSDEAFGCTIGFIVLLLIGFGIYGIIFHKKRKDVMSKYCQENGLKYTEISEQILDCNEQFDMILRGKNQYLAHIISGTRGDYEFQIFDFNYTLEKPHPKIFKATYDEGFTESICCLKKKGKNLPHFYMLTQSLIQSDVGFIPKVKEYIDVDLLRINNDKETVVVKTRNEEEILDFFDLPKTDALQTVIEDKYIYEGKGEYLLVANLDIMSIEERLEMLNSAVKVFEAL